MFASFIWGGLVRVQADFALHEYLICKETKFQYKDCKQQLRSTLRELPSWIQYEFLKESKTTYTSEVVARFLIMDRLNFQIIKVVALPLASSH